MSDCDSIPCVFCLHTHTHTRSVEVESNLAPEELKQLLAKGTAERDRLDVERVSHVLEVMEVHPIRSLASLLTSVMKPTPFSLLPHACNKWIYIILLIDLMLAMDIYAAHTHLQVEGLGAAPAARHEHIPKMSLVERELERMVSASVLPSFIPTP